MLEIAGYELIEVIATGGMATVWKARQVSLDRTVAIKILDKGSLPDETALERFRKEAQTAARLNHPNIVQVFDTGEADGHAYLVMEYVEGQSVGEIIAIHGAINEARALDIIEKTAEALSYAWDKECLIHCDVNPNNILIERATDNVKVTDLGIARMIGLRRRENEDSDLIVGTPNYTSPEQSAGINDLDCRTDMYSVGATLYHMVTGLLPFHDAKGSGAMTRHEIDFLEDPQVVNPELSSGMAWLIEKLMIKNRALRPLYWSLAIEDFHRVKHGGMPKAPLPEEGESTVRRSPNRKAGNTAKPLVVSGLKKKPTVKLAVKKSEAPEAAQPVIHDQNPVAEAFRNTVLLLFVAAVVYAGFYFYGKFKGPPEPVIITDSEPGLDEVDVETADDAAAQTVAGVWHNEDFITGARYFNQALADYNRYQQERLNPDVLVSVEENCREAIAYFEACKDQVPDSVDIDQYIKQANGLIFDAHQSRPLDLSEESTAPVQQAAQPQQTVPPVTKRKIVFIDDEPEPIIEPEPDNLLKVALSRDWDQSTAGGGAFGEELGRLLARQVKPSTETDVDPDVVLYPGITCMMKAKDAAQAIEQNLPIRRPLETPGMLTGSLYYYTFSGDFYGARELIIVCDGNDRVVMVQLYDDRPAPAKMSKALFSSNWTVYDYINGRTRNENDGLIAHQVRLRNKMIRIDTELADGAATDDSRMISARVVLMMPARFAGMLVQINQGTR